MEAKLNNDNCLDHLTDMDSNNIEAVITDPPYGLEFMGKDWDKALPNPEVWEQCYRVLKPGAFLLSFAATRLYHRLAVQIEDAGFDIHPMVGWIYGSGFPKATDISKMLDKRACKKELTEKLGRKPTREEFKEAWKDYREVKRVEDRRSKYDGCERDSEAINERWRKYEDRNDVQDISKRIVSKPVTELAQKYEGYKYGKQALKPALEPILVAQKPHNTNTQIDGIMKTGCGAFAIDDCRVDYAKNDDPRIGKKYKHNASPEYGVADNSKGNKIILHKSKGRFPANLVLSCICSFINWCTCESNGDD